MPSWGIAAADRARARVRSWEPRAGGVPRLTRALRGDGPKRYPPLSGLVSCVSDARGRRERACPRRNPGGSCARRGANAGERDGSRACGSPRACECGGTRRRLCEEQARKKAGSRFASRDGELSPRLTVCSYGMTHGGRKRVLLLILECDGVKWVGVTFPVNFTLKSTQPKKNQGRSRLRRLRWRP